MRFIITRKRKLSVSIKRLALSVLSFAIVLSASSVFVVAEPDYSLSKDGFRYSYDLGYANSSNNDRRSDAARVRGDVDGNGKVNAVDYAMLKRTVLKTYNPTDEQYTACDVNDDGKVNPVDYAILKRHVLGTYYIGLLDMQKSPGSEGLEYTFDGHGAYVIGIGTCADEDVVIPRERDGKAVIGIEYNAFYKNNSIKRIYIPSSVKYIKSSAFRSSAVEQVFFEDGGLAYIDTRAFGWCLNLKRINIPKGTVHIYGNAFEHCEKLETIAFPDTLKTIEAEAFDGCCSLKRVDLGNGVTSIRDFAFKDAQIGSIHFPASLRTLATSSFFSSGLKEVTFEEGVETIGYCAFANCGIENVVLPASLKELNYAFGAGLRSITINGTPLIKFQMNSDHKYITEVNFTVKEGWIFATNAQFTDAVPVNTYDMQSTIEMFKTHGAYFKNINAE